MCCLEIMYLVRGAILEFSLLDSGFNFCRLCVVSLQLWVSSCLKVWGCVK